MALVSLDGFFLLDLRSLWEQPLGGGSLGVIKALGPTDLSPIDLLLPHNLDWVCATCLNLSFLIRETGMTAVTYTLQGY